MPIIKRYMTRNPYFGDGKWISGSALRGFMLHSVATPQPDPAVFIRGWDQESYTRAGISGFIGADAAYLTAPCLEEAGRVKRMPHAGMPAGNNGYIGFEMCEPRQIVYNANGTKIVSCSDPAAAAAFVDAVYENAVELFAALCTLHGKDPRAPGVIVSHREGHAAGIASNHGDPDQLWGYFGQGYTMDRFRRDVAKRMAADDGAEDDGTEEGETDMRFQTLADLKADSSAAKHYLPTVEKLIAGGILAGRGGSGDERVIDLSEDSVRLLVMLDRAGVFGR